MNSEKKNQSNDSERWHFNINNQFGASFLKTGIVKIWFAGMAVSFCFVWTG